MILTGTFSVQKSMECIIQKSYTLLGVSTCIHIHVDPASTYYVWWGSTELHVPQSSYFLFCIYIEVQGSFAGKKFTAACVLIIFCSHFCGKKASAKPEPNFLGLASYSEIHIWHYIPLWPTLCFKYYFMVFYCICNSAKKTNTCTCACTITTRANQVCPSSYF